MSDQPILFCPQCNHACKSLRGFVQHITRRPACHQQFLPISDGITTKSLPSTNPLFSLMHHMPMKPWNLYGNNTRATPLELAELGAQGVTSGQNLPIITYDALMAIFPQSGLLTRRKLLLVGDFIGRGQTVTPTTTIQGIVLFLKTPNSQAPIVLPPTAPHTYPQDPTRRALKLYANALTEFSGQPIECKQRVLAARATLGQTVYGILLENPLPSGDVILETRNKELFHMLLTAFMP
jgi:hypothetical protein